MAENVLDNIFSFSPNCSYLHVDTDAFLGPQYVVFVDVIAGVGLLGNVCCFLLMMSRELRHLSYSVLLRVLAVLDSIVLVFTATEDTLDHGFDSLHDFASNRAGFAVWTTVLSAARMASPWLMGYLAFNRLALILYTPGLQRFTTVRAAVLACVLVLLVSLLFTLPWDAFLPVDPASYVNWTVVAMILFNSLLPCLAILATNLVLGVLLRRSLRRQAEEMGVSRQKRRKVSRYTITIVAIAFLTLVCLLPKAAVEVVELLLMWRIKVGGPSNAASRSLCLISKYWPILNCLMLVNFAINFYVLVLNAHLRQSFFRETLACCGRGEALQHAAEENAELIEREDRGIALTPLTGFEMERDPE